MKKMFILALVVLASESHAQWMGDYANSLTNSLPSRSLLTNLLAAVNERTLATYTGAVAGVDLFAEPEVNVVVTNTVYDYNTPVFCGAITQTINGVTYVYTNYCPSESQSVTTNEIGYVPSGDMLDAITLKIERLIPLFIDHSVTSNNYPVYDQWFSDTTNSLPPAWNMASVMTYAQTGVVLTNGTTTNGYWTISPLRDGEVLLARMVSVPTTYIVTNDGPDVVGLFGDYAYNAASNHWERDGEAGYILRGGTFGSASHDRYTFSLSTNAAFDFLQDWEYSAFEYSFVPIGGQWSRGLDTNVYTVSAVTSAAHSFSFSYTPINGEPWERVNPLHFYSNVYPSIIATLNDASNGVSNVTVMIQGREYGYNTNSSLFGFETNATAHHEVTGAITPTSNRWAAITNVAVYGEGTNASGYRIAYTNAQYLFDVDGGGQVPPQWYREALVERYKVVNSLRHTFAPANNVLIFFDHYAVSNCFISGEYCDPAQPTHTGYVSYVSGGYSNAVSTSQLFNVNFDGYEIGVGSMTELDGTTGDNHGADYYKFGFYRDNAYPAVFASTQSPPADVSLYIGETYAYTNSDGGGCCTSTVIWAESDVITNATTGAYTNSDGAATAYIGDAFYDSVDDSTIQTIIEALTDNEAVIADEAVAESPPCTSCTANPVLRQAFGRSASETIIRSPTIMRWRFAHLDE